jgi:hypothetical protein
MNAPFHFRAVVLWAAALLLTAPLPVQADPLLFFVGANQTVYSYDGGSQFTPVAGPANGLVDPNSTAYDSADRRLFISDRATSSVYIYDTTNNTLVQPPVSNGGLGKPLTMTYDYGNHDLIAGTDMGNVIRYHYDTGTGMLSTSPTTMDSGLKNPSASAYDATNNVIGLGDRGDRVIYQYDSLNRTTILPNPTITDPVNPTAMTYAYRSFAATKDQRDSLGMAA